MDPAIFKAYDIRGLYPDQIDKEAAWKIGYATAQFLTSILTGYERSHVNARSICIGRDMRIHSEGLAAAMAAGMNAFGANVIDIGLIDTPQIYFAINHLGTCGGVQVTASHNPATYNGFKISGVGATPIGADTGLQDIEHIALALPHTMGVSNGSLSSMDLTDRYKQHVLKFLRPNVRKLKIAVDASNGMAGKVVPAVFGELPIKIIPLNFAHEGTFKHDPNPLVEKNLSQLKGAVKKYKCHFGVCFDGDADRLIMVDEKGDTIGCDHLTALMVPYFLKSDPNSTVVYDLRSSRVVVEEIIAHGGTPRRQRVGHAFIKKAMKDSHAVFGGELSGHFYYRDNFNADSGLITLVHMLNIISESDTGVSELVKPLRRYSSSGELNFKVEDKQAKMNELARRYSAGRIDQLDGITIGFKQWWFNCRPSNTEPLLRLNVEADNNDLLKDKLSEITSVLGTPV